jgi:4'-phosphopantetheinyl transferase
MQQSIEASGGTRWVSIKWHLCSSPAMAASYDLTSASLHVFRVSLAQPVRLIERLAAHLDAEEMQRALRFRFEVDRGRFVASRGMLREVLGSLLGVHPRMLRLAGSAFEKPRLLEPAMLEFNITHSADDWLLAVSAGRPVGVDFESFRTCFDEGALAMSILSPAERRAAAGMHEERRRKFLQRCWVVKEASLKATGVGLSVPLDSFDAALLPAFGRMIAPSLPGGGASAWQVLELPANEGSQAAVVIRDATPVRLWLWTLEVTAP